MIANYYLLLVIDYWLFFLQQLHDNIQDKRPAIRKVINDGQQLLKQCAGKEIIDVQQKLDSIQNRYDNIEHKSEDRLHQLEQAIPLAADFDRLQREFSNWLDQAERELRNFDPTDSTDRQKAIQEVCVRMYIVKMQYVHCRSHTWYFLWLRKFLKKLADNQCSSITKGWSSVSNIYTYNLFNMEVDWPEIWRLMEASTIFYICTYSVFTLWGRNIDMVILIWINFSCRFQR